jgi:O-antigen ligase
MPLNIILGFSWLIIPLISTTYLWDYFTTPKWLIIYLSCIVILAKIIKQKTFLMPKMGQIVLILGLSLTFYLVSIIENFQGHYLSSFMNLASFGAVALTSYGMAKRNPEHFNFIFRCNLVVLTIVVVIGTFVELINLASIRKDPSIMFFGTQNMASEFVGLAFLILILSRDKISSGIFKYLSKIALILSPIYLLLLMNRTAISALIIALITFTLLKPSQPKFRLIAISIGCTLIVFIMFFSFGKIGIISPELSQSKTRNTQARTVRWANTLRLIQHRPLGVGPNNYAFEYIPFSRSYQIDPEISEATIILSPHNWFLQVASENGIFTLICLLVIIFYFIFKNLKTLSENEKKFESLFFITVSSYLLTDALFAFPLDNAFPFLVTAYIFGIGLIHVERGLIQAKSFALFPIFIFLVYGASAYFISKSIEANLSTRLDATNFACKVFPENWRACLRAGELAEEKGAIDLSREYFQNILKSSPNNFLAIKSLALSYLTSGDLKNSCGFLGRYNQLLGSESSVTKIEKTYCNH